MEKDEALQLADEVLRLNSHRPNELELQLHEMYEDPPNSDDCTFDYTLLVLFSTLEFRRLSDQIINLQTVKIMKRAKPFKTQRSQQFKTQR